MALAAYLSRVLRACATFVVLSASTAPAGAQSITNVATARWSAEGSEFSTQSNEVRFDRAVAAATISLWRPAPGSDLTVPLRQNDCPGVQSSKTVAAEAAVMTPIAAGDTLRIGPDLVVRVEASAANSDARQADTLRIELRSSDGEYEVVTARESGTDSGIFFASIHTSNAAGDPTPSDCLLSLSAAEQLEIAGYLPGRDVSLTSLTTRVLADPFGTVFDSSTGAPVDGAEITLIDMATGAPARVFAPDGVTPYPARLVSGQDAVDAGGTHYAVGAGEYWFPLAALGSYRIDVKPPSPYRSPSQAPAEQLAQLQRPGGGSFAVVPASYGASFQLASPDPLNFDIPLDAPAGAITLDKNASVTRAQPGDAVFFKLKIRNRDSGTTSLPVTIEDIASPSLRFRPDTLRINDLAAEFALTPASDGRGFRLALPSLGPGAELTVSYAMSVRSDASPGLATNRATGSTTDGNRVSARTSVTIERDSIAGRMTLIGSVIAGGCRKDSDPVGIAGVRVMLEDGSFAVTDEHGQYHFAGLSPGTHVVQVARETLPAGGRLMVCRASARSARSASSQFVRGGGGSLARADFHVDVPPRVAAATEQSDGQELSDREASGAETDWFASGNGPAAFLFPAPDHNPRTPSVRVAIRHGVNEKVSLLVDGEPANPLNFDSADLSPDKQWRVSLWRGIRLGGAITRLTAIVRNEAGKEVTTLEREVAFADTPLRAELVREQSRLIADGVTHPVLAVRMLDRFGRPVHAGISGSFVLEGSYEAASAIKARSSRALTGFGNAGASWVVEGDDGIARIELAPTMVSGSLGITFPFSDGETSREERLEAWIEPGDQPWTLIALAEGSVGARSVADHMEAGADFASDLGDESRVAFYAKGRVLGRYLLTLAYDSARQKSEQPLLGTLDPSAYYTVFGDVSERLYDAASRDRLYLRIESSRFHAFYGDLETGFAESELGRYQRVATGLKGEAKWGALHAQGFVARIATRHRRDEIQGGGISGPYTLSSSLIVANSEQVSIEVRDRLRSEIIIDRRELTQFVDYEIDLLSGTISFSQPVLSRDAGLNPQFIVIDYEADGAGGGEWNGGVRATWTSLDGALRFGATMISDRGDAGRTQIAAGDARLRIDAGTEIRGEAGISIREGMTSQAYSLEVEHHSGPVDLLAYARWIDADYGTAQQNLAERGRRKAGADARLALTEELALAASGWIEEGLGDSSERRAVDLRANWRSPATDAFAGIAVLDDRLPEGNRRLSKVLQAGATQHLFDNRLELSGTTSVALGKAGASDLPARHQLSARYSITRSVKALASYELAKGDTLDARTLRAGLEVTPWTGGRLSTTLGRQALTADSKRSFAGFALGQTFQLSEALTLQASIDGNRTLGGGIPLAEIYDPDHPVSSGGHLGELGQLAEDFTATSLGLSWSQGSWNARLRGEYRDGELARRKGASFALLRQLGEGSAVGGGVTWTRASDRQGATTEHVEAALSAAYRPGASPLAILAKLEYRGDLLADARSSAVTFATGERFRIAGDTKSRRLLFGLSTNWQGRGTGLLGKTDLGLFSGVRHNFDQLEGVGLSGTSLLGGLDWSIMVGDRIELGGQASVRGNLDDRTVSFAFGPELGFIAAKGALLSIGYNLSGFRDPDFRDARETRKGIYARFRLKLDSDSLDLPDLGGGR